MADGATVVVESSWALNTLDEGEAQTVLCAVKQVRITFVACV